MAHVFQVGAGSGGVGGLDLVAPDPPGTRGALVRTGVDKHPNGYRHPFPPDSVRRRAAGLAVVGVPGSTRRAAGAAGRASGLSPCSTRGSRAAFWRAGGVTPPVRPPPGG